MMTTLRWLFSTPIPLRFLILRSLDRRFDLLRYPTKLKYNTIHRPYYGHCLLQAALLARKLGHASIATIEFGVAGGNGLVELERHSLYVTRESGVRVEIYGFDTGKGLPEPVDYRDMP